MSPLLHFRQTEKFHLPRNSERAKVCNSIFTLPFLAKKMGPVAFSKRLIKCFATCELLLK